MRILISPAKKMVVDRDSFAIEGLPVFLEQAERLKAILQRMSPGELQALWRCGDSIARLNVQRLKHMDLRRGLTPAILSYEGIQYRYMGPGVMETAHLDYIQKHLYILSGFYGLLRPFDGVTPYRLEMQARLPADGCQNLYQFWGDRLARQLALETDVVLNLASQEYSKAVQPHLPDSVRFVSCVFAELENGRIIEKGTRCKMARGQMVRWLAENHVTDLRKLPLFDWLGYQFSPSMSEKNRAVFLCSPSRRG
ncbi:MAG: peroxide stress protein YaaA [Provencibacterium sp.]|nr:peroxide stress protein YaaA [Provencibacterium sp.]